MALVALFGIDSAVVAQASACRHHKSASVAIRAAVPACAPGRAAVGGGLAAAAAALAILLMLGRQTIDMGRRPIVVADLLHAGESSLPLYLQHKVSISYHSGGLYGP